MRHYKTVQVTDPAETGSAAAGSVQAKLLQGLQTPRSGLCFAVSPDVTLIRDRAGRKWK